MVPSDLVPKAWWGDVTKFSFAELLLVFWAGNEREAYPAPEKMFHLSTTIYHSRSWPRQAISFHFVINHGWHTTENDLKYTWFHGTPQKILHEPCKLLRFPMNLPRCFGANTIHIIDRYNLIQHSRNLRVTIFWSPPGLSCRFSVIPAEAWIKPSMQRTWRQHIRVLVVWQKRRPFSCVVKQLLGESYPKWPTDISSLRWFLFGKSCSFGTPLNQALVRGVGNLEMERWCGDIRVFGMTWFQMISFFFSPSWNRWSKLIIFQLGWNYQLGKCSFFFPFSE